MSDTSASGLTALCGTFIALTTIVVTLRFYTRKHQKVPLLADDWLMIPGLASYIGASACVFLALKIKIVGYSSHDFTPEEMEAVAEKSSKLQIGIDILTILCLGCSKTSALFFYRRIFCVSGRKATFNIIVVASIVAVVCWVITFEFLTGFQCHTHFSALWDGTYGKYCTISFAYLLGQAISDFLLDFWILALPIPLILRLHTTTTRKMSILGVFLLACIGLGMSIGRMVVFIQIHNAGPAAARLDQEKILTKSIYFMSFEAGISLVAVNLPSIWLLFATITPEAVLRSVRSLVSLASVGDRPSKGTDYPKSMDAHRSSNSVSSAAHLSESQSHTYAMHNVGQNGVPDLPTGKIHIENSVQLTSEQRGSDAV